MKKKDSVTGEEFECIGDASCWCMESPRVLPIEQQECVGPTRLKALIKDNSSDRELRTNPTDHGSSLERKI